MDSRKYIGVDVHKESISIAVRNDAGKIVMECVIETKAFSVYALGWLQGPATYRTRSSCLFELNYFVLLLSSALRKFNMCRRVMVSVHSKSSGVLGR